MFECKKIVVVMPAYNAEKTLARTVADIPKDIVDEIILVDDHSQDGTIQEAKRLGLYVFQHNKNRGYGGNQKTCYQQALKLGADIVVMVHPDYQYNPNRIPQLIAALTSGDGYDAAFGSRMLGKLFREGGMPVWKFYSNIILTAVANMVFLNFLTEYHSGFRAYTRRYLETVCFERNSDDFVFDTEIIAQGMYLGLRFTEIPIETRYFPEASQINFARSAMYGIGILLTLVKYQLHRKGLVHFDFLEGKSAPHPNS
jgi:glycosyltransferase involved in cell wall biosynthesis